MARHVLQREQWVPAPPEAVFAYFADATHLEVLTPPWLHFHILPPEPRDVQGGLRIAYRLRWRRLPIRWRTRIADWDPPRRFVDVQEHGPYRLWHHTHDFEPHNGGTVMRDTVQYELPLGLLGGLMHRLIVRNDLEAIFDYRAERIAERFGGRRAGQREACGVS